MSATTTVAPLEEKAITPLVSNEKSGGTNQKVIKTDSSDSDHKISPKKRPFSFRRSKVVEADDEKASNPDEKDGKKGKKAAEVTLPPVSFFALYRFHTKFELFLNLIGIFCAICSGSAQVRIHYSLIYPFLRLVKISPPLLTLNYLNSL